MRAKDGEWAAASQPVRTEPYRWGMKRIADMRISTAKQYAGELNKVFAQSISQSFILNRTLLSIAPMPDSKA